MSGRWWLGPLQKLKSGEGPAPEPSNIIAFWLLGASAATRAPERWKVGCNGGEFPGQNIKIMNMTADNIIDKSNGSEGYPSETLKGPNTPN